MAEITVIHEGQHVKFSGTPAELAKQVEQHVNVHPNALRTKAGRAPGQTPGYPANPSTANPTRTKWGRTPGQQLREDGTPHDPAIHGPKRTKAGRTPGQPAETRPAVAETRPIHVAHPAHKGK